MTYHGYLYNFCRVISEVNKTNMNKKLLLPVLLLCMTLNANSQESFSATKQAVYKHYSAKSDSLKRKAADYLFKYMPYHYYETCQWLESYQREVADTLGKNKIYNHGYHKPLVTLIHKKSQEFKSSNLKLEKKMDAETLDASYIIDNIDQAFEAWQGDSWSGSLSIDDFCKYVLPYRIGGERPEIWRKTLRDEYLPKIDQLCSSTEKRKSPYWAATYLNNAIKSREFLVADAYGYFYDVDIPVSVLRQMQVGSFRNFAMLTAYVMRACGLAVTVDFTPMSLGSLGIDIDVLLLFHTEMLYWNTVLDKSGRKIPFIGGWSNPGYPCFDGYNIPKIYRLTYEYQPQSLAALNEKVGEGTWTSDWCRSPFVADVTDEYYDVTDVEVNTNPELYSDYHFVYLKVPMNYGFLEPVAFAERTKSGKVKFTKVVKDNVYVPSPYSDVSSAVGYPIKIDGRGRVSVLKPDFSKTMDLTVDSLSPFISYPKFDELNFTNTNFDGYNGTNDDKYVNHYKTPVEGVEYELTYFIESGELADGSGPKAVCKNGKLEFHDVPTNAMMMVRPVDFSVKHSSRYFTVVDGKIVWL